MSDSPDESIFRIIRPDGASQSLLGSSSLTSAIRLKALELGFAKVGISRAETLDDRNGLNSWLSAGHHGEMRWMEHAPDKRIDPSRVLLEVKSVVSLALNYYTPDRHSTNPEHGKISRYAWGRDYHFVLKERLRSLARWISEAEPDAHVLWYSDTGPLMDKAWAHKGGMGWIGKHSNLITRELGSWVFLGEILVSLVLEPDQESRNYCGTCHRCLDACPTGAIVSPYVVDARLCISYLTIELREAIPKELRPMIGSRIFGCDDCQDVCPWNRFAVPTAEQDFHPNPGNHVPALVELLQLSESEFQHRFRNSPVKRAKYRGFLRNVAVALGNSGNLQAVGPLSEALKHREALLRSHAAWALGQIGGGEAAASLAKALEVERDPAVLEEIKAAIQNCDRCGELDFRGAQ